MGRTKCRLAIWAIVIAGAGMLSLVPLKATPWVMMVAICGAVPCWLAAWRGGRGTALRGAVIWAGVALALGLLAQTVAVMEPLETGRPGTARITYLVSVAILAALISILGARNPGSGAWAILMLLMVLVLLIPWLEEGGRVRQVQGVNSVRLGSPWTLFYGLLVLAGVTNFLPTRYGLGALAVGAGLSVELVGLMQTGWTTEARSFVCSAVIWLFALGCWIVEMSSRGPARGRNGLERLWFWFRDHWGVVWALRVQERFNRQAELSHWPQRLTWFGVSRIVQDDVEEPTAESADLALATFRGLVRRFVTADRIAECLNVLEADLAVDKPQRDDKDLKSMTGRQVV